MMRRVAFGFQEMFYPRLSPSGKTLLIRLDGIYRIQPVASHDTAPEVIIGIQYPHLSPDWITYAVVDERTREVDVWSVPEKRRLSGVGPFHERVVHIEFAPNGQLAVFQDESGTARLCRVRDGMNLVTVDGTFFPPWPVFSARGGHVAVCVKPNTINVYRTSDGSLERVVHARTRDVWAMAITADGDALATGGQDGLVEVW